jgi:hypothetical protein
MNGLTWNDAGSIALLCLAVVMGWIIVAAVLRGEVRLYGDSGPPAVITRAQNPIKFWLSVALYGGLVGLGAWVLGGNWLHIAERISK